MTRGLASDTCSAMGSIANKLFAVARMLDDPKQSAHVAEAAADVAALEARARRMEDDIATLRARLRLAQSCYNRVTEVWS